MYAFRLIGNIIHLSLATFCHVLGSISLNRQLDTVEWNNNMTCTL